VLATRVYKAYETIVERYLYNNAVSAALRHRSRAISVKLLEGAWGEAGHFHVYRTWTFHEFPCTDHTRFRGLSLSSVPPFIRLFLRAYTAVSVLRNSSFCVFDLHVCIYGK